MNASRFIHVGRYTSPSLVPSYCRYLHLKCMNKADSTHFTNSSRMSSLTFQKKLCEIIVRPLCVKSTSIYHCGRLKSGNLLVMPAKTGMLDSSCKTSVGTRQILTVKGRRCYSTMERRKSSLFVTDADPRENSPVDVQLDLENLLSSPNQLNKILDQRNMKLDVNQLVSDYKEMKKIKAEKEKLEYERNEISTRMAALVKEKATQNIEQSKDILIERGKEVKTSLKQVLKQWWDIEQKVMLQCLLIPNSVHPNTPVEDKVLKSAGGDIKDFPDSRSHVEVGREKDLIKFSNIGPKTYYLKGELAVLERQFIDSTRKLLRQTGLSPFTPPDIYRSVILEGSGVNPMDKSQVLTLQNDDEDADNLQHFLDNHHLCGTSVYSFIAYLTKMKVQSSSLPLQYFTIGRHYSPGGNLPGLFGALQATKAVIFGGCATTEESVELLNTYTDLIWSYLSTFNIPIRLVTVAAPNLSSAESLQYKFEAWSPSLQQYIQVSSLSLYGDFISRRLMCIQDKKEEELSYLHMIGGDMLNITRLLALSLEYNDKFNLKW